MENENFIFRRRDADLNNLQHSASNCNKTPEQNNNSRTALKAMLIKVGTPSPTPLNQAPDSSSMSSNPSTLDQTEDKKMMKTANLKNLENKDQKQQNHKVVIYFGDSISNRNKTVTANTAKTEHMHILNETPAKSKCTPAQLLAQVLQRHHARQPKTEPSSNKEFGRPRKEKDAYIESLDKGIINIKIERNYQLAKALVKSVAKAPAQQMEKRSQINTAILNAQMKSNKEDENNCGKLYRAAMYPTKRSQVNLSILNKQSKYNKEDEGSNFGKLHRGQETNMAHKADLQKAHPYDAICDWSFVQEWRRSRNANNISRKATGPQNAGIQHVKPMKSIPAAPVINEYLAEPFTSNTTMLLPSNECSTHLTPIKNFPKFVNNNSKDCEVGNILNGGRVIKPVPQRPLLEPTNIPSTAPYMQLQQHSFLYGAINPKEQRFDKPNCARDANETCLYDCHSSSDENRSSGHASMSDTGGHGSCSPSSKATTTLLPLTEECCGNSAQIERNTRSRSSNNHSKTRQRTSTVMLPWSGSGIEDIKTTIQHLNIHSQTSTSSTYSSLSATSQTSEILQRLANQGSQETLNTNVTSADEFVWLDSHDRLVELKHIPWTQQCLLRVLHNGRCKEIASRVANETVCRVGYLLQRCLVRLAREIQRLSAAFGLCSKQEVTTALKIVLCKTLADSCLKACLSAAAMFAAPGDIALKQSKSARAGLQLSVGRFYHWITDTCLGKFVHEYAAVYLCASMENLLEELILQHLPPRGSQFTIQHLEQAIACNADWWGLLQPFAHLNAGRIASGELKILCTRNANSSSINSLSTHSESSSSNASINKKPGLLTTCVGSIHELKELTQRLQPGNVTLSHTALNTLHYFMRCAQLEHESAANKSMEMQNEMGNQELCHERAYFILPPLVEWLRVAAAHAAHRYAGIIDRDDIMQAARLLLPGVDCSIRPIVQEEDLPSRRAYFHNSSSLINSSSSASKMYQVEDAVELGKRATLSLAFKLMLTGRAELLAQALSLLPHNTRFDTLNHMGMTALMIAATRNDEVTIQALLDAGCDPNIEVPAVSSNYPAVHPDTQHWTAVTFAACCANYLVLRMLLERGGKAEGGMRLNEEIPTLTPLQVACGNGNLDIVTLLLAHGANQYLSTQPRDSFCLATFAQRGCYSAVAVAAANGHRECLRLLLEQPATSSCNKDILSLEEMLAESDAGLEETISNDDKEINAKSTKNGIKITFNKAQFKALQEAMYHSSENKKLDITLDLHALGVPWTLHCWLHTLATAHDLNLVGVIDQLLQDFIHVCPDDFNAQLVYDGLPLLFDIFRSNKNETTALLLADIFTTCYGIGPIQPIEESESHTISNSRIDPKFINNPELSDVAFRVEGKIFYGHKIVLVTASPRFRSMFNSKLSETNGKTCLNEDIATPVVQINDIRYHIFELAMQYLYCGYCTSLSNSFEEILELMAAASYFQLQSLLHYTERRCTEILNTNNVVPMYIHAKVYNAQSLLSYCQGFLLQNLVALLTEDDCVKRLLFGKKIPNHDVIGGLLQKLQERVTKNKLKTVTA